MESLFSYGTLQKEKVQLELFGRKLKGIKDAVEGYRLSTIEIKDESVVSKSEQTQHLIAVTGTMNDIIRGMVLEITPQELKVADEYETEDYMRVQVQLESGNRAWMYVAANQKSNKP
jgi:gamma-glutamylcyclotransferase (GGCT)/AIG2-like uncharacterized protein YtfP